MTSSAATVPEYRELIKEAYIKPIRSVMVVDDEFPTLETMIESQLSSNLLPSTLDLPRARKIISFCRNNERNWMVELHNGVGEIGEQIKHFHHTDLMILDYHLNSTSEDNTQSINVLRSLASNNHFNLVIVYTKGYAGTGNSINNVVTEIVVGLSSADNSLELSQDDEATIEDKITNNDELNNLINNLEDSTFIKIKNKITQSSIEEYLNNRECTDTEINFFLSLIDNFENNDTTPLEILRISLHRKQRKLAERLSQENLGIIGFEKSRTINWIRTNKLFITVISKNEAEPDVLEDELLKALVNWNPPPHRLLMAKMRAELDEQGVSAEDMVLDNKELQEGWLNELITKNKDERSWAIYSSFNQHWEGLGDVIRQSTSDFVDRSVESWTELEKTKLGVTEIPSWKKHHDREHVKTVCFHLNNHANCKPNIEGPHLMPGHILRINITNKKSFWVCLSPACDLVPRDDKNKPLPPKAFIAVELIPIQLDKLNSVYKNAHRGDHIFIKEESNQLVLEVGTGSNPKWMQMFASNGGIFGESKELNIVRLAATDVVPDASGAAVTVPTTKKLELCETSAQIVAQLRYEYALNLMHRLGSNLSRVGLDFASTS